MLAHVNSNSESTRFNSRLLLDGTFKDIIAQIGPSNTDNLEVDIEKIEGVALGEYWNLGFDNSDFSETGPVTTSGTTISVPGWTIELSQVALGPDDSGGTGGVSSTIGGFATPPDPTPYPTSPPLFRLVGGMIIPQRAQEPLIMVLSTALCVFFQVA